MAEQSKELSIREATVDLILAKVQKFQQHGELDLPPNYSAANALKSAWLILQQTVDKDKKPVLRCAAGRASPTRCLTWWCRV